MNNRGSALIIVLIIMSFIVVLGVSLANVTYSEKLMSTSYDNSETAYYIAEAGIERSVFLIDKDIKNRINLVLNDARALGDTYKLSHSEEEIDIYLTNYIKIEVNKKIKDYFIPSNAGSFSKSIDNYQKSPGGIDTSEFPKKDEKESYYTVTAALDIGDAASRTIVLTSTGNYGNSVRTITAKYFIQDTEEVTVKTLTSTYDDLDIFMENAINSIGPTATSEIANHTTVEGNVLLVSKKVDFQSNYESFNGNLIVKAEEIEFGNKASVPGNIVLDIEKNIDFKGNKFTAGGDIYSSIEIDEAPYEDISSCSFTPVVTVDGETHIPDYQIKQIVDFNIPNPQPAGVNYIYKPSGGQLDSSELSTQKYNVVISNGKLTLDKKIDFYGLIYCTGVVEIRNHSQINGIIIAYDLNVSNGSSNHLTVEYRLPPDPQDYNDIVTRIKESIQGELSIEINLEGYRLFCHDWK